MRFAALSMTFAVALCSQNAAAQPASAEAIEAHVRFLADDLLAGREDGTIGYDIAAAYVKSRLIAAGLQPGYGYDWYQPVPLVERRPLPGKFPSLLIDQRRFEGLGAHIRSNNPLVATGEAVFVGYGLPADDKAAPPKDLVGKIAVAFAAVPKGASNDLQMQRSEYLKARGAVGLLLVDVKPGTKSMPYQVQVEVQPDPPIPSEKLPEIMLSDEAVAHLSEGTSIDLTDLRSDARHGATLRTVDLRKTVTIDSGAEDRRYTSPNILGVLRGSDPELNGEIILVVAHLDHIGERETKDGKDAISNGALDNAAGVASMLEIARALAGSKRTRRTIIFAAVTAEENGMLGSKWLAKNFPGGLSRVVAVVNLDMPILTYDFNDIVAYGDKYSTLGQVAERVARRVGVNIAADPVPDQYIFARSDHISFVEKGVPGLFVRTGPGNGGAAHFQHFIEADYHKPSDDLTKPILWSAGAKFASLNLEIIREIANNTEAPRWYSGNRRVEKWAPDAPKVAPPAGKMPAKMP